MEILSTCGYVADIQNGNMQSVKFAEKSEKCIFQRIQRFILLVSAKISLTVTQTYAFQLLFIKIMSENKATLYLPPSCELQLSDILLTLFQLSLPEKSRY